jgi:hypothetical protein
MNARWNTADPIRRWKAGDPINIKSVEAIMAALKTALAYFQSLPEGSQCWVDPQTYIPTDRLAMELAASGVLAASSLSDEQVQRLHVASGAVRTAHSMGPHPAVQELERIAKGEQQ